YHNAPNTERANFTITMLIDLVGNGLIDPDQMQKSLTYIEIANRYGVPAVKEIRKAIASGYSFEQAITPYPVKVPLANKILDEDGKPMVNHVARLSEQTQKDVAQNEQRVR